MRVEIDQSADAARIQWAGRAPAASRVIGDPDRGVRLFYDAAGRVVGLEVLWWSARAEAPAEVVVTVRGPQEVESVAAESDHPLARALRAAGWPGTGGLATDADHRPVHEGEPMLGLPEAAALLGRERSWVSREMAAGRLRALKVGRQWWTARPWLDAYLAERRPPPGRRRAASVRAAPPEDARTPAGEREGR